MNTNEYYENVRREIGIEFGLDKAGYAPTPAPALSISQSLYLINKYPKSDPLELGVSDKAMLIGKRYATLKKVWSK